MYSFPIFFFRMILIIFLILSETEELKKFNFGEKGVHLKNPKLSFLKLMKLLVS